MCGLNDLSRAYEIFVEKFTLIYDKCFLLRTMKARRFSLREPWFTKGLAKCKGRNISYKSHSLILIPLTLSPKMLIKPVTHEQVFFDKFWLGKFYLLVCKEEFVNFFLDKCTCSKASMIAFEQVHLARKKLSHCRICSSVRVDKENLSKKIRKLRAHSGLVVVMFRISYWSERKKLWKRPSSSSLSSCTGLLAKPWDWLRLCVARGRTHHLRFICLFECSYRISKAQPRPRASNLFSLVK